jgi:RND family efflux transporter MFP subunit
MKRWISLSLFLGMFTLPGLGCSQPRALETSDESRTVAVARISPGDVAQVLSIAAEFRPFQEIDVHSKVAGYVKAIYVDVGDRVRAGQLLAVLEVPELQDELRQDQATIGRAQEEVKRAQADLDRAESAHEVAHLAASRLSTVLKARPNLVAQQDIDEATGRDRVSEAQVATAKAAVASALGQLEIARAVESKTKTLLAYSQITVPFAGVITHRYADTGAMIQAGTASQTQAMPLVKLSQNDLLRLVIPVPESSVSRIHLGASVDLEVRALQKTFKGSVARFADRLDADTRTMRVEVDVKNPNLELVPGMYAVASLVIAEAKGVLVAPVEALDRAEDTLRVLIVNHEQRIEPRTVSIGLETEDRVEIKTGLDADDLVVVGNRARLKAGSLVSPKVTSGERPEPGAR